MAQFVPTTLPAEVQLKALIQQRDEYPHQQDVIEAEIRDRFLAIQALIVMDMADFSRLTQLQGIIPTLSTIYRMRDTAIPLMEAYGGTVFKVEADNLYATFDNPDAALDAAIHTLNRLNAVDLHASIGIGYGEVLLVGDRDLYGNEMNLTSKLGEDLAEDDAILLTAAAYNALTKRQEHPFTMSPQTISDVSLEVYRYQRVTA